MGLNFDLEEIGLIALIALIFLSYWIFLTRVGEWFARRFFPHSRARRDGESGAGLRGSLVEFS